MINENLFESHKEWAEREAGFFASKHRVPYFKRSDIEQGALLALWLAVERFDPSRGFDFEAFARKYISGQMKDALAESADDMLNVELENNSAAPAADGAFSDVCTSELFTLLGAGLDQSSAQVLRGLAGGLTQAEISKRLGISRYHIGQAMKILRRRVINSGNN